VIFCDIGAILLALGAIGLFGAMVAADDTVAGQHTAWRAGSLAIAATLLSACMFHIAMRLAGEARSEANSLSKGVPYQRARRMLAFGAYYIITAGVVVLVGFYGSSRVAAPAGTEPDIGGNTPIPTVPVSTDGSGGPGASSLDEAHRLKLIDAWVHLDSAEQTSACSDLVSAGATVPAEAMMARVADGAERDGWTAAGVADWLSAVCKQR
jgi:hypothetical protein